MIVFITAPFQFILLKALFFTLPLALLPLLARVMIAWKVDPEGADADPAILGWGLGAVLTPSCLLVVALSDLDARLQILLTLACLAFIVVCVIKIARRMRFHGLL